MVYVLLSSSQMSTIFIYHITNICIIMYHLLNLSGNKINNILSIQLYKFEIKFLTTSRWSTAFHWIMKCCVGTCQGPILSGMNLLAPHAVKWHESLIFAQNNRTCPFSKKNNRACLMLMDWYLEHYSRPRFGFLCNIFNMFLKISFWQK